jgi:hypothetical protein
MNPKSKGLPPMPLEKNTLHTTPCGLRKMVSRRLHLAYDLHCETQCPDAIQPFCTGEPHALACQRFHLREGWKPLPNSQADGVVPFRSALPDQPQFHFPN